VVIAPFWRDVVVIGAAAVQIVLAEDVSAGGEPSGNTPTPVAATRDLDLLLTPTRDVDLAVETVEAEAVAQQLEAAGLQLSDEPHERGFTWVRDDDLKIQLVRPFHPFPGPVAERLPQQPAFGLLREPGNRMQIAFAGTPEIERLHSVTAASLIALKQVAFGRTDPDGNPVERDFHDVFLVASERLDELGAAYRLADYHVRTRVDQALAALAAGGEETRAAARQNAQLTGGGSLRAHELSVRRAATFGIRRLAREEA
jgi:hypothetical protein